MKIKATELFFRESGKEFEIPEPIDFVPAEWAVQIACANGYHEYAQEHNFIMGVNAEHKICGIMNVNVGTDRMCPFDMKSAIAFLILSGAVNFVFAHNHPNGSCMPSVPDVKLTRALKRVGSLIDCHCIGSVVVGKDGEYCDIMNFMYDYDLTDEDVVEEMKKRPTSNVRDIKPRPKKKKK